MTRLRRAPLYFENASTALKSVLSHFTATGLYWPCFLAASLTLIDHAQFPIGAPTCAISGCKPSTTHLLSEKEDTRCQTVNHPRTDQEAARPLSSLLTGS